MKVLVIYAYHESESAIRNLEFFQDYGMYIQSGVDYILSVNGSTLSAEKSDRWNQVLFRDNEGYDFGAWKEGLNVVHLDNYDYFIFLNNTVRGPFGERYWINTFCDLIDDKTKLVGVTINCHTGIYRCYYEEPKSVPHVQSMVWCTDRIGIDVLLPIFERDTKLDKNQVVINQEIGLSRRILSAGYNMRCILKSYDADYTQGNILINVDNGAAYGDPWYENSYFDRSLHPYETIFFKTNRGVNEEELEKCTKIQRYNKWY